MRTRLLGHAVAAVVYVVAVTLLARSGGVGPQAAAGVGLMFAVMIAAVMALVVRDEQD